MTGFRWCGAWGLVATLVVAGAARAGEGYDECFERSRQLEEAGDLAGAFDVLDELADDYSQDYALFLRLGWLAYQAQRWSLADAYYSRAAELSGDALEPRLGLAWTDLLRGRRSSAARRLESLRAAGEDDPRFDELAEALEAPPDGGLTAGASLLMLGFPGYTTPLFGAGFVGGIGGRYGHFVAGLSYRFSRYSIRIPSPTPTDPGGGTAQLNVAWNQHELYPYAGVSFLRFGITAHYALLDDGLDLGDGHVIGVVGRYSPLGDLSLEASYSIYADDVVEVDDVFRAALSWRIPVVGPLTVVPGGALQLSGGTARGAGSLAVGVADERGEFWLGGKGGREVRPVYLAVPAAYNTSGVIPYGASVAGRVRMAPDWWLGGSLELQRHGSLDDDGTLSDDGYFGLVGSLGVSFEH
jgi:hypothetical protein